MAIPMKNILKKFDDCNKFSLTGGTVRYNIEISREEYEKEIQKMSPSEQNKFFDQFTEEYTITEEEFLNALAKKENKHKEEKRKIYEKNKEKFVNYPPFDELYEEIKQECYDFDCEENRLFYRNKYYNVYKEMGMTEETINEIKTDFFECSFITDNLGKTTKYGNEHRDFFQDLYFDIAEIIDCQKDKDKYCIKNGKSPLEQIPEELKEHFLYYEVSYSNEVTEGNGLRINYYFELNDETKKYLLKFKNDFCLEPLDDLALYKDDELKFCSCAHEEFNSIETDYKDMTIEEISDFINDKYFNEDNSIIIDAINKIIEMPIDNKFSFKELNIENNQIISVICSISQSIGLNLETVDKKNTEKISRAIQLFNEGKYKEAKEEMEKYQPIEGHYEPLEDTFREDYDSEILFKKTKYKDFE